MEEKKKSSYRGYTPARAQAYQRYIEKYKEVKVRMTPEQYEQLRAHVDSTGESANAFIIKAIEAAMSRA